MSNTDLSNAFLHSQHHVAEGLAAPILPPNWLGIMGGGQLGRMFTQAAQAMGYKVCVLEPDADCPAGMLADKHIVAAYNDEAALREMAQLCRAVSTEFENVPAQSLDILQAAGAFVAPSSACVSIAQNRVAEKKFLAGCADETGIHAAPHWVIEHAADVTHTPADLLPGILKISRMGYDGKGQARVENMQELQAAWDSFGHVPCVLEKRLPLAYEVSALVARAADGSSIAYPLAENVHCNGILHTTTVPSPSTTEAVAAKVRHAAQIIAGRMGYVGVLCIEFFVLTDGSLVANEMAPRPHNSGHYTMDACVTSQFEQQVRAMAGLPLGSTFQLAPAVMLNILGDEWFTSPDGVEQTPAWQKILGETRCNGVAKLHLYGKVEARVGRKMGHLNCIAASLPEAQVVCQLAEQALGIAR